MTTRTFTQRGFSFDPLDEPSVPPGMTLLGYYQTFWFAQTASGAVWTCGYKVWRAFCSADVWPTTRAYAELQLAGRTNSKGV